jgi:hypothetical protein
MKRKTHTEKQIIAILKEHEAGVKTADLCRNDTSISGIRVARELDRLLDVHGKPKTIVSDNDTELTSNAILRWVNDHKVE